MKTTEIPQDPSALDNHTKDLYYVVDGAGKYTTGTSRGWQIKATALNLAWEDIEQRIKKAKEEFKAGKASSLLYFMELNLMDITILSDYSGFWKWQIKRHLTPSVFNNLSDEKLKKYADLFEISVDELKNPKLNEDRI